MHHLRLTIFSFLEKIEKKGHFFQKVAQILKISYISAESFLLDKCLIHASALAFKTLLSLVPFIAIVFAVLKGLGVQHSLREQLLRTIAANLTEVVDHLIIYIEHVNAGALGILGLLFLLVTVFGLFSFVEKSFNNIWGIKEGRHLGRKVTDYFTIVFLSPFFAMLSISAESFLRIEPRFDWLQFLPIVTRFLLPFIPLLTASVACFILYMFLPNSKIRWQAALGGGIIAGCLWIILQRFYLDFTGYMHNLSAIYQGFVQVPLFFLWIYCIWIIVLYGAEVAFAIQNRHTYLVELYSKNPSFGALLLMSILVIQEAYANQQNNCGPTFKVEEIAESHQLSIRLLHSTANLLVHAGLARKIQDSGKGRYYFLFTVDLRSLSFSKLMSRLLFSTEDKEEKLWDSLRDLPYAEEMIQMIKTFGGEMEKRVIDMRNIPSLQEISQESK